MIDRSAALRGAGLALATALLAAACSSAGASPTPVATATATHAAMASESAMASHAAMASESAGAMKSVSIGTFHAVDGTAAGTAAVIHLADGSFEISLEDFSIAAIAHTDIILVTNTDVLKTTDIDPKAILDLGPLKAPSGMQEFVIPASMAANAMGYHTVVLWDTQMLHAIAVAPQK